MKLCFGGVVLAAAFVPACSQVGKPHQRPAMNHPSEDFRNRPHSHVKWLQTETACAADVKKFCEEPMTPTALPETTGDPFLDWIFIPFAPPPPEIQDITRMMDRIFDPLFMEPSREHVTLFWVQEPHHAPHFLVDAVAARAAQDRQPEEIPQLASDLQQYGKQIAPKLGGDSFQYSMARRLTELDTKTIQRHVRLPFSCQKNRCLLKALEDGKLSSGCKSSIQELESTFALETQLEQRQAWFLAMMWVYIATLCILLLQLVRKMRSQGSKRLLRLRILQAVFSNPEIKRKVEDDLGQSVGNVPPVSLFALRLIGSGGEDLKRALRCMKRVHMMIFVSLLVLVVVAPFWVLPVCILISILRVVELCRLPTYPSDGECECCCCGANTTDAKNGNLTEEQQCCSCCKGSGVCSPSCADCCGPKSCSGGCCGRDCTCCCCCSNGMKAADDCQCCCCGASTADAKYGNLTVEQECCGCCKGTGVCSPACANCCGGGKSGCDSQMCCNLKGRGEKHVVTARNEVYCGVPLQVV